MYTFLSVSLWNLTLYAQKNAPAAVRILVEHFLSYGNEVSYTIRKPGAKFPVKHRAFLYVILSEPPEKTSTEFYINP